MAAVLANPWLRDRFRSGVINRKWIDIRDDPREGSPRWTRDTSEHRFHGLQSKLDCGVEGGVGRRFSFGRDIHSFGSNSFTTVIHPGGSNGLLHFKIRGRQPSQTGRTCQALLQSLFGHVYSPYATRTAANGRRGRAHSHVITSRKGWCSPQ